MTRCLPVDTMRNLMTRRSNLIVTRNRCIVWICIVWIVGLVPIVGCATGPKTIRLSNAFAPAANAAVDRTEVVGNGNSYNLPGQTAPVTATPVISAQIPSQNVIPVTYEERFSDQSAVQPGTSVRVGDEAFGDTITATPVGLRHGGPLRQMLAGGPNGSCQTPGCNQGCLNCAPGAFGDQACGPAGMMLPMIPNPQGIDGNEFLCNGGDQLPKARARVGDQIVGVEVEDTVARYTTVRGETHVTPSNRVCVYAPRFGSVRRVTGADIGELAVGPHKMLHRDTPIGVDYDEPGLAVTGRDLPIRNDLIRGPDAMRARDRGVPVENVLQPQMAEDVLALLANLSIMNRGILIKDDLPIIVIGDQAATIWSVDQEVVVAVAGEVAAAVTRDQTARELVVYELPNGRLRICKVADRGDALPGEIVTFMLRVDNVGDSPLSEIVLTDSLSARLQYVPESQKNTVDAEFSTSVNDDNSLRMTWKFPHELKVGEGTTIEFKCKVR